ncbi:MAG: SRPBCC domain-containing protein [Fulvivirga sp.]
MNDRNKTMEKLYFSVSISAPKEKVWATMLDDSTYRKWTSAFTEGSHYKGSWEEGSKMLFLAPNGHGMVSKIAKNKPFEYISIEHLGFVKDGEEDLESEGAKATAGAHENYTFKESDGITEVSIDTDTSEAVFQN